MAHEIEELDVVLSVESPEWHGLAKVKEKIGMDEIAPMCFDIVQGTPSVTCPDGTVVQVDGYKMLLADIRHRANLPADHDFHMAPGTPLYVPLHAPKDSYEVISNREVFEMAKEAFEALGCVITTAGTLGNLRKFFLSVDIGDKEFKTKNGDSFQNFLNFITSHDGTYSLEVYDSSIRIVCMNTFRWSRETAGEIGIRMMHTKNVAKQMANLPAYLESVIRNRRVLVDNLNHLQTVEMSPTQTAYFMAGYLACPTGNFEKDGAEKLSTKSFNRANTIRDLSVKGRGNQGRTLYDAWNGATEYFTHGDSGSKTKPSKRITASKFGQAAEHKDNILAICLDSNRVKEYTEFGEKLYRDAQKALAA